MSSRPHLNLAGIALALAIAGALVAIALSSGSDDGAAAQARTAPAVDAIRCDRSEQVLFHIHAHLAVYDDGRPLMVPAGIGIREGSCFYWLHSHTADGVIHIESPVARAFTLGDFFDVWGRPLGTRRVAGARGAVTGYVDGRPFGGDPRSIVLTPHRLIQLDVGRRVAPRTFAFPPGE
jgi:hypothetical protein